MRLDRIQLENFRQHEATELVFGPGLTGIIGPNGSGKTTILEAIAWALYGNPAARGKVDSLRFLRARPRSSVRVEIDFALGPHEYRVWRSLRDAELWKDGQPVANSLTTVTQQLTRLLGMSRQEFFNTYFTGQKDLAVMATMGPTERGQFLSRLLGYERLRTAQERLRERRSGLRGELVGLEAGLSDERALVEERTIAEAKLAESRKSGNAAAARRDACQAALETQEPVWREHEARRERALSLEGERRIAEAAVKVAHEEFQRLDRELAMALKAREELAALDTELLPLESLRAELDTLDAAARAEGERQGWLAGRAELAKQLEALDRRLEESEGAAMDLAAAEAEEETAKAALYAAGQALSERRTEWVRDRQDAETKRQALRDQYREAKEQHDMLQQLGPEGICPTCQRPLGTHHAEVVALLERQLEEIEINGRFFRRRVEQLEGEPPEVREAAAARERAETASRSATERVGTLKALMREREALAAQRVESGGRLSDLDAKLAEVAVSYDAQRHDEVRRAVRGLEPAATRAAQLGERAGRATGLVADAERAEQELSSRETRWRELGEALKALGFDEARFTAERDAHRRAVEDLNAAEVALAEARGQLVAAEERLAQVERRAAERQAQVTRIGSLRRELRLHDELDRAFGDLRTDLNAQVRPDLSDLASAFLSGLTDGRYDELLLDEQYRVTILEDGVPKPVISGGEEDLANLTLRLAISQLVADRAGQPLSLLVLDEIFGSLDEQRRVHVVDLLRRLRDRFAQVILITHIESVREGLDRVMRVTYDASTGTSVVSEDTDTLPEGDDEDVAA